MRVNPEERFIRFAISCSILMRVSNAFRAAFFCNSPRREPGGLARLKYFASHGHLIANHTADHLNLNTTPITQFTKNIDQADSELRGLQGFRKWFRFPYLHEGKSAKDVEAIRAHLNSIGYAQGYVTVDTEDWYVDEVLRKKQVSGRKFDEGRLCQAYARMMSDDAQFFDEMSVKALKRSVKHVILLHETDLNALCLGTLIQTLKAQNWTFISPDLAYSDPIAAREPRSSTKLNQGRVFALAVEGGYKGPLYSKWNEETEIESELELRRVWQ